MSNVFGIIVAGRLLQTDFVQAGETQFVATIPEADTINHVVVFLTGVQPFPENTAGAVYIRWAKANSETNWHCLGFISNGKPSAIFKVAQLKNSDAIGEGLFSQDSFAMSEHGSAQIGISVETLPEIQAKTPALGTEPNQQSSLVEFCEKMLKNFVNHAESFAVKLPTPEDPSST
uniref:Hikeshi-like domain-containing protein n=1 Tax=Plectus sambesii TaxID=2011161 RepID=A0A914VYA1_9BILA